MSTFEPGADQISLLALKELLDNDQVFAAEALAILENDYERPKSTYTLATSATALLEKWIERNELPCRERGVPLDITSAAIVLYPDENGDYGPAQEAVESTWLISLAEFSEQVRHCHMTLPKALVRSASEDELRPNQFGYTIEGAARAIATKYGVPEQRLRDSIFEATAKNALTVRDPQTGLPYTPKVRRDFWERISVADINVWLDRQGVDYRLDCAPEGGGGDSAAIEAPGERAKLLGVPPWRIVEAFRVMPNKDASDQYLLGVLSDHRKWIGPPVQRGHSGGKARPSLWNPVRVAMALHAKGKMTIRALDLAMQKNFAEFRDEWDTASADIERP